MPPILFPFLRLAAGLTTLLLPLVDTETVDDVLGRSRTAMGAESPAGQVLSWEGRTRYAGLDGRFRFVFAPDGRFRMEIHHALGHVVAFDGEQVMGTDRQGVTRRRVLTEADDALLVAALLGGSWLRPDAPVSVSLPDAGNPSRLHVSWTGSATDAQLLLDDDWRDVGGRFVPWRLEQLHDATIENRFEVERAEWIDDDQALFRLPAGSKVVHEFDSDVPAELDVRRVPSGHQLVRAKVDGELCWFIFDSGAGGLCLSTNRADAHDMPTLGETVAVGGGGTSKASLRQGQRFGLGPLTLEDPVFVELDLSFLTEAFGVEVAGIVGYEVLAHAIVELTPSTDRIALFDPEDYELRRGRWAELLLDENIPTVRGHFEDEHDGLFHLDTGADHALTFHAPIVESLGLLEGRELRGSRSEGVGGAARMWNAPISSFEVAGQRFEDLPARFATTRTGTFAGAHTAGNIGQGLLRDATLVFDYPNERLAWIAGDG
jgi:hypothetical protein